MFSVYVLKSGKDGSFYIGQTQDLSKRLLRHNAGLERYTKKKLPWELVWSTAVATRSEALQLEKKLKNFKSRVRLQEYVNFH